MTLVSGAKLGPRNLYWQLADGSGGLERLTTSDHKAQPCLKTKFNEAAAQFSLDGNWVAYASDESGRNEIYVQPYPGPGGKWQISTVGGREPLWNRNSRELFYRNGNKVMAVEITTKPSFSPGTPKMLFEG